VIQSIQKLEELAYRIKIDEEEVQLIYVGVDDPDEGQMAPLVDLLRAQKQAVLEWARRSEDRVSTLERGILAARDLRDLDVVVDALNSTHDRREITQQTCEQLAEWAVKRSHHLPEKADASAGSIVWAESLTGTLASPEESCSCCGQDRWWQKGNQRICAVCHPKPGRADQDRSTERR
jgi:hypothetical protein